MPLAETTSVSSRTISVSLVLRWIKRVLIVLARIRVGGGAVDQETRFRVLTGRCILYDAWRARLEDKENDCLFCLRHRSKYVLHVGRPGATALNVLSSPLFFAHLHLILDRAAALRLPAIYDFPEMAEEGGFAAYGPRLSQFFVKVMPQQIVKLFKGAKVADVPVEQPTTFELVINLKTAKALGLTVSPTLLARADQRSSNSLAQCPLSMLWTAPPPGT